MGTQVDIAAVLFASDQGNFLGSSLAAVDRAVRHAEAHGRSISCTAVLYAPTLLTRRVAEHAMDARWRVIELPSADLSTARNAARRLVDGRFVAFLDGDDLWCEHWLTAAHEAATRRPAIWRPEVLLTFGTDFHAASGADYAAIFQPIYLSDPAVLLCRNALPSGFFTSRDVLEATPWPAADAERGWVAVDSWWNCDVAGAGYEHRAVASAFHYRRIRAGFMDPADRIADATVRIGPTRLAAAVAVTPRRCSQVAKPGAAITVPLFPVETRR